MKELLANAFWSLSSHVFYRGSLMLAAIVLARRLSTDDFAAWSYFQLTTAIFSAYAAMGLGVAASRYFAEVGHEQSNQLPPLAMLFRLSWGGAVIASLVVYFFADLLGGGLDIPPGILALGVLVLTLGVVPNGAVLGLEKYRSATVISFVSGSFLLVGTAWAAYEGSRQLALLAVLSGYLLQSLGLTWLMLREVGWRRLAFLSGTWRQDAVRIFSFAGPMTLVSLASASGSWLLGRIILTSPEGAHNFALYSIGMQWFSLSLLLPGIASRVLLPRLVRLSGLGRLSDGRKVLWQGVVLSLSVAFLCLLVVWLGGDSLLSIYGETYTVNRWFLPAYMAAALLSAPINSIGNAIVANQGQWYWFGFSVMSLVVLLVSGYLLRQKNEWMGALSQTIASATLLSVAIIFARRRGLA